MATTKELGTQITTMIIDAINRGESLPWVKPWKGGVNPLSMGAISYATGKPYNKFVNQLILGGSGEWITFKECRKCGGHVKKGAKSRAIFNGKFYDKVETDAEGNEKIKRGFFWKPVYVFNVLTDCEGIEPRWTKAKEHKEPIVSVNDIPQAEQTISDYIAKSGITFENTINSASAFYSPNEDKVVVPNKEQFSLMNEYYSTVFHEFTHSTLKSDRCNRPQDENGIRACFGNSTYAKEELVAELGACMILASLGISTETTERNSAAYLKNWLGALKNDTTLIITAATKAEMAVDFILNKAEETKAVA